MNAKGEQFMSDTDKDKERQRLERSLLSDGIDALVSKLTLRFAVMMAIWVCAVAVLVKYM
jgi:hypothetical protein